jgi:hypothetical protein
MAFYCEKGIVDGVTGLEGGSSLSEKKLHRDLRPDSGII